jgi:UDP-glucuronate 4-epimerase
MRVLVTGGAGFVGSHLSERLIRDGHRVTVVDDLNDFYPPALKRANLEAVAAAGPFRFQQADICDSDGMAALFADCQPEVVVHLAARAGVRPSLEQPLLYERVNGHGTLVVLEQARRHGVGKFVFASSSSVYGNSRAIPFREDGGVAPISPYAATKLAGEAHCQAYAHLYALPVVCLRLFTVYGPRQRPDLAIRKFAGAILAGRPVPVFGDGASCRDYTYIRDTVDGIVAAIDFRTDFEILNLGAGRPVALHRMLEILEIELGRKAERRHEADQPGDVPATFADISKARRLLGYDPATPIEAGIRHFVEWFRGQEPDS